MVKRIYIRRYKQNPDYWEVVGGSKTVRTGSKTHAQEIADAQRRVRAKRSK